MADPNITVFYNEFGVTVNNSEYFTRLAACAAIVAFIFNNFGKIFNFLWSRQMKN